MTIQPFRIHIPPAELVDLRERLTGSRWPQQPEGTGWERGVPRAYLEQLAGYWTRDFDWRAQETRLNALSQNVTDIEGQQIHFIHVRSPEPNAMPLMLTHGWPSTPFEFARVIGALTDPRRHLGDPADAFHVVAPALPGYGFSTPLAGAGWGNLVRVAFAWLELMDRLGYDRFAAHGTDVGSGVTGLLSMLAPSRVLGTHVTGTTAAMPFGPPLELDHLPEEDRERAARFNNFREHGIGYLQLQATRPQTLGYSLNDSPVGLLAWIVEKFHEWTDPAVELPEDAVGRDELLTNVSLFWFTGSGASSAHAVYEGMQAWRESAAQQSHDGPVVPQSGPPRGIAVFAGDTTIRSVMDPQGTMEHWSEFNCGGHFPAMETPELLTADLRAFFRAHGRTQVAGEGASPA